MRSISVGLLLFGLSATCVASDAVYEGTWLTTNRKLDGTLTCVVTNLGGNRWHGHFYGTWEGVSFSYDVEFSGPPHQLHGTAKIDGAHYDWTGTMTQDSLQGQFGGDRYMGRFNLKQTRRTASHRGREQ